MAFERLRGRWERLTAPLLELFGWLRPNHLTWASLFAALAAASIALRADRSSALPWLAVSALMSLAFILDGLDGQLARKRGLASAAGDLLDHTLDRVVDVALLVALGSNTSWFLHPELGAVLGWAAALTTMLGSYMGTAAQSVGLKRDYGGFSRRTAPSSSCSASSVQRLNQRPSGPESLVLRPSAGRFNGTVSLSL